jgi:autotransporter-associated beta strand protein
MSKIKNSSRALPVWLRSGVVAVVCTFAFVAPTLQAANYTWDGNAPGGAGNAKWSTANNWGVPNTANTAPPTGASGLTNADVFFAGALKTTPQMDNPYSIRTLTFNSGAASFTLTSQQNPPNAETLAIGSGGIINNSANLQTLQSPLVVGAWQTWNASAGHLQISGSTALGTNHLTISGGFNTTVTGTMGGSGALAKTGGGTLTLTASNNFSGGTTVGNGTLAVNNSLGSATGTNSVTIFFGATLTGTGVISGPVTVNGNLLPGNSPGILTINNNLTLGSASSTLLELGGTGTGLYDRVVGIGKLTLDGTISVSLVNGFNPSLGDSFDLLDFSLLDASNFNENTDLILPALLGGWRWDKSNFLVNGQVAVIPEPASAQLLGASLLGLLIFSNRRRSG